MDRKLIFKKYKHTYIAPWWAIYVQLSILEEVISELFDNWFKVSWYDFLRIFDKWTQPFIEYSVWKEVGFTYREILENVSSLKSAIQEKWLKEEEIYLDVLIKT